MGKAPEGRERKEDRRANLTFFSHSTHEKEEEKFQKKKRNSQHRSNNNTSTSGPSFYE
jgi:hypothetical protein